MATLLDYHDPSGERRPAKEPSRLQSPSSILMYKQCPRKYFYRYIARLPTEKSIHLVRGLIAHKVLEDFYDTDLRHITDESFPVTVKVILHELFRKEWQQSQDELDELDLTAAELEGYREETKVMINNFFHYLMDQLQRYEMPLAQALEHVKPKREIELRSKALHVRGYADAVHEHDGKTYILDYKTSKKCEITPEYKLQLSIYGMIFAELDRLPDEVGIFFLKHGQELRLPVTQEMVEFAKREVRQIHELTGSRKIEDYPMNPGPLCKWRTGQCDYYDLCFGNRKLSDFDVPADLVQIGK